MSLASHCRLRELEVSGIIDPDYVVGVHVIQIFSFPSGSLGGLSQAPEGTEVSMFTLLPRR